MYKKYIDGKKAVFFDLDGTIVDTKRYINEAVSKVLEEIKAGWIDPNDYYALGESCKKQWKGIIVSNSLKPEKSIDELAKATHDHYIQIIKDSNLEAKSGFWDLVYELKEEKKLKLALTTNSTRETTDVVLEKIGASNLFDFTICGDEVKKKKPSPEMYKKATKVLRVKPKEVTVFEDSLPGAKAAAKAKMDLIIIWNEETPKYKFPGNVLGFMYSFEGLAGNLDLTYLEALTKAAKEYHEIKAAQSK